MTRPTLPETWASIARTVSHRATCPRLSVGAVLVRNGHILSTGYNGAPYNRPHCIEDGCLVVDGHCQRSIHAEVNAIIQARDCIGAEMWVTHSPCWHCMLLIEQVGIRAVYWELEYKDGKVQNTASHRLFGAADKA